MDYLQKKSIRSVAAAITGLILLLFTNILLLNYLISYFPASFRRNMALAIDAWDTWYS